MHEVDPPKESIMMIISIKGNGPEDTKPDKDSYIRNLNK